MWNVVAWILVIGYASLGFYFLENERNDRLHQDHRRAVATCSSSTELRSLLNDIGNIVVPPAQLDNPTIPESEKTQARAFLARIHRYTDSNPACENIP